MVDPRLMCRKHLLGEHVECHMFVGSLQRKKNLQGFIDNNLFEPETLFHRHEALVIEMERRGMNHKSRLPAPPLDYLTNEQRAATVDADAALEDLISRCPECAVNYKRMIK